MQECNLWWDKHGTILQRIEHRGRDTDATDENGHRKPRDLRGTGWSAQYQRAWLVGRGYTPTQAMASVDDDGLNIAPMTPASKSFAEVGRVWDAIVEQLNKPASRKSRLGR